GDGSCAGVALDRFQHLGQPLGDIRRNETRRTLGVPQDVVLVSFVGRLSKDKGIAVLADAWLKVSRRPKIHLLLAGEEDATDPVPADALDWLRRHPSVHAIGSAPPSLIPSIYAASD